MADEEVLAPQGYEAAETIADNNIIEVYQPDSDGIRRNKQETVDIMKIYFRTLPSYTANRLLMASSTGLPVVSSVSQSEVTTTISQVATNVADILSLEDKVGQSLNTSDSVTFDSVTTDSITTDSGNVDTRIDSNASDISSNSSSISTNASDISTLEGKVGQSLNTSSSVTFNSVTTDNVAIKHKKFTGTLDSSGSATITHGLSVDNIMGLTLSIKNSVGTVWNIPGNNTDSNSIAAGYNSTSVIIISGSQFYSQSYKIIVTYQA